MPVTRRPWCSLGAVTFVGPSVRLGGTRWAGGDRRRFYIQVERSLARWHKVLGEPDEREPHDARDVRDVVDARKVDAEAVATRQQRVVRERERVRRERELDWRRVCL